MTKARASNGRMTVRDSKSGRLVTVRGYGALKGLLEISNRVDLTKPIAAQAMRGGKQRKSDATTGKR